MAELTSETGGPWRAGVWLLEMPLVSVILPWHLISGWNFVKQRGVLQGEEPGWVTGSSLALLSVAGFMTLANSLIPRAFQHLELLLQRGPASRLSVLSSLTDAQKLCWPLVEASLYTCIRFPPSSCCVNLTKLLNLSEPLFLCLENEGSAYIIRSFCNIMEAAGSWPVRSPLRVTPW